MEGLSRDAIENSAPLPFRLRPPGPGKDPQKRPGKAPKTADWNPSALATRHWRP